MEDYTIEWLVENHVIYTKVLHWDNDDMVEAFRKVSNLVDTSNLPLVHTIWDGTEIETYPTNLKLIHSALTPLTTNKKLGWMITVIDNPLIGFLAQAGTSIFKVRYHTAKTLDAALDYLQERDPRLATLK